MHQKRDDITTTDAYIYYKIRRKSKGYVIRISELKQIIQKDFLCDEGIGGNKKGFPRILIYDIIKDMENLKLIKKLNHITYQLLPNSCDNRFKKYFY